MIYDFGPFRFLAGEKLLVRDGRPVALPPKAIDTLAVLLGRHGHVVLKNELMGQVWPDTFVEEGNLTQQISLIRRALNEAGDGSISIETIPRRGYRLIAPVREGEDEEILVARERTRTEVVVEDTHELAAPRAEATLIPDIRRRSTRWMAAATGLAVAVGLAGSTYWWATSRRPVLPIEQRDWVLILDFENATGDPRFDRALASAFSVGLEQSPHVNVFSRARAAGALRRMGKPPETPISEEIGMDVARRDGVRALVAAGVARVGHRYVLTARLIDPRRGVSVGAYTARATNEDQLLDALDELSRDVREGLGESRASISQASRALPQVTTASFAALHAYVDGGRAWNRGRLKEGIEGWERAVALDPAFALAHAELGAAYSSHVVLDEAKSRRHFEAALAVIERTTDRERLLIEARFHASSGHWPEVIRTYDSYLTAYPDDPVAQLNRALALMRTKRHAEAIAGFEQVLRISPGHAAALLNIATTYKQLGQEAKAVGFYTRAFESEPSWIAVPNLNHEFGFALVGAGDLDRARDVFRNAVDNPETTATAWRSLALVDMYEGKYRDAEARLDESTRASPGLEGALRRARNQLFLAMIREGQGRSAGVIREVDRAAAALAELPPNVVFTLRTAAAYARAGAPDRAERLVQGVRALVDPKSAEQTSELRRAEGEVALARGDSAAALAAFRAADQAQSTAMSLESLARAHSSAGLAAQAIESYEALIASPEWLGWEPQHAWLVAHVRLAEYYAGRGDVERAIRLLDDFLGRWQHADPDLTVLANARRLRQGLKPPR